MSVSPARAGPHLAVLALFALALLAGAAPAGATGTASISGSVTDSHGAPITTGDVCVTATHYYDEGADSVSVRTDGAGHYSFTGLAAGYYAVYFADCADSSRNDVAQHYDATGDDYYGAIGLTEGQA